MCGLAYTPVCGTAGKVKSQRNRSRVTYRKDEAVLKVGELFVTLFTAEHAILLVYHFFVAVLAWTGLVKAVFLAQVHNGSYAGVVVCLKKQNINSNALKQEHIYFLQQHEINIKMTFSGACEQPESNICAEEKLHSKPDPNATSKVASAVSFVGERKTLETIST